MNELEIYIGSLRKAPFYKSIVGRKNLIIVFMRISWNEKIIKLYTLPQQKVGRKENNPTIL